MTMNEIRAAALDMALSTLLPSGNKFSVRDVLDVTELFREYIQNGDVARSDDPPAESGSGATMNILDESEPEQADPNSSDVARIVRRIEAESGKVVKRIEWDSAGIGAVEFCTPVELFNPVPAAPAGGGPDKWQWAVSALRDDLRQ
jgi:hypothetical protein